MSDITEVSLFFKEGVWKVTLMFVTDVGDEMCWWQLLDFGDGFGHFGHQYQLSFYISVGHQHHDVSNKTVTVWKSLLFRFSWLIKYTIYVLLRSTVGYQIFEGFLRPRRQDLFKLTYLQFSLSILTVSAVSSHVLALSISRFNLNTLKFIFRLK